MKESAIPVLTRPGDLVVPNPNGKQRKKSILDHFGPFWTMLDPFDYFGPFWTMLECFGPFGTIFDRLGQLLTILDNFELNVEHVRLVLTIFYHFEQILNIMDHFGTFWTILDHIGPF